MPTISFSFQDFQNLLGKKLSEEQFKNLLEYAKADFEGKTGDLVNVKFNDTNQPYLWCVEGLVRLFKGLLEIEKGVPFLKVKKSDYKIFVDKSVKNVRPYIAAFVAKNQKIDEYFLTQLIQMQEKITEHYGRKRQKLAIGVYPLNKIQFPVKYKTVNPSNTKFIPLDGKNEASLSDILLNHQKGKQYGWILKEYKSYPILIDAANNILSFPPIINSEKTGKLCLEDDSVFFEATGTDLNSVILACTIFSYTFADRGFEIFEVAISSDNKVIKTPLLNFEKIKLKKESIKKILGLDLSDLEIKKLLEKNRFNFSKFLVEVPPFRQDILHPVDIIEDIAIMYGYNNIKSLSLTTYTVGSTFELTNFVDVLRKIIVGLGYQEIFSAILSNKIDLYHKMNVKDFKHVEIDDFMSESYSVVRTWLIPNLMDVLSKNKHVDYPQKIFECGLVTLSSENCVEDHEKLSLLSSHSQATFTEMKQLINFLFNSLKIEYSIDEETHTSFIPGRCAKIIVKNKTIGFFGEIHPQVLVNWKLEMPTVCMEMDVSDLFSLI